MKRLLEKILFQSHVPDMILKGTVWYALGRLGLAPASSDSVHLPLPGFRSSGADLWLAVLVQLPFEREHHIYE